MKATCAWCGKDLGYDRKCSNEPESCGARECEREIRRILEADRMDRENRAEYDEYERYRH